MVDELNVCQLVSVTCVMTVYVLDMVGLMVDEFVGWCELELPDDFGL